ncbi:hypothetical protein FTO60_08755 [Octadecabacter sp. SW4]|uniref:hypothetical protein n=1 Tax=Octadecabacter sp. SW4 TaxID=2602067 RepID=UPI0011C1E4C0|nr:hypothetical protein [Octadecabacter sp. SW4]QEE35789.1 hypothetical protein FTO60_08755 [Octadecabacter sp. SW4]
MLSVVHKWGGHHARRLFTIASLAAISFVFTACDGGGPLTGWLPSDTDSANEVFQNRVALAFPDGTRLAVVDAALKAERFSFVSDDRGISSTSTEGTRFASKQWRFDDACSRVAALIWQQRAGAVYDMSASLTSECP